MKTSWMADVLAPFPMAKPERPSRDRRDGRAGGFGGDPPGWPVSHRPAACGSWAV